MTNLRRIDVELEITSDLAHVNCNAFVGRPGHVRSLPCLLGRASAHAALPAAGWGLVTLLLGYAGAAAIALLILAVGIFLGVVTLGGLARAIFGVGFSGLGLVFAIFTLLVSYGSKLIVAYLGGRLIVGQFSPQGWNTRFGLCWWV
jgi:hypothetical protein